MKTELEKCLAGESFNGGDKVLADMTLNAKPVLLIKSGLLAGAAAFAARYTKKISLVALLSVILAYQVIGTAFEWAICGNFFLAVQDFRIGIPGMLIQWFGGYALLKAISKL